MKLILLLFAFSLTQRSIAQDFNIAMSVSKVDLEKNYYEKDSTANALVIYDYGNSYVDSETFWLRVQVKQKVKILRAEGKERGEIEVKLYKGKSSTERIENIKGTTFNLLNGEMIKTSLTSSGIFREENDDYIRVKFVLPNVNIGSVITYSYETQSRFMTKYQPWFFQGQDPVLYSEYNTSIPGNYDYNIKLVGSLPLVTNETELKKGCIILNRGASADCSIAKYVMKNIPAYKPEGFTTTALNYMARIEYELSVIRGFDGTVDKITKTWSDVDNELRTDSGFGRQIDKKSLVKNILPEEISTITNDLAKAKAIYQFVLDHYKWNGTSERYDVSVKRLIKEKVGSVFEINLLLQNLLAAEDLKTFPVLLSTRANGLATKIYPVLTDFNYVVLKTTLGENHYFLDATDPYLSFGELPFRCLNQYGRLMNFEDGSYWENVEAAAFSSRQHHVKLFNFDADNFSGTIESRFLGYHAHDLKRDFNENPKRYKEKKADKYSDIIIEEFNSPDFDITNINFSEKIDFSIAPEFIDSKIYLNPFIIKFFDSNPFKLQERTYPIDFGYKDTYSYTMTIDLNEQLKVVELPEAINISLPEQAGTFNFKAIHTGNQINLYFRVKFSKSIYAAEFYESLKIFMNNVVDVQKNTVIVLEKQ
jgi:hypothetical protein